MKPVVLDVFCGAGGASEGYASAGFKPVGVDIKPQPNYPFEFIQADALDILDYLLAPLDKDNHGAYWFADIAAIHASPPCQGYIQRNKNLVTKWPKLIEPVRERLVASGLPYVIENVPGAPLRADYTLCGTQFGLPLLRHRIFETNWPSSEWAPPCNHWGTVASGDFAAVYAFGGKGHRYRGPNGERMRVPGSAEGPEWSAAMGIDWMTKQEMSQAIPPAYTEFIGRQLLGALNG